MKRPDPSWHRMLLVAGWTHRRGRGGHHVYRSPDGRVIVIAASSSDHRAWRNVRSDLRRAGVLA